MDNLVHNGLHHDPRLRDEGRAGPQVIVISDDDSDDGQAAMLSQAVVGDSLEDIEAFVYRDKRGLADPSVSLPNTINFICDQSVIES